MATENHRLAAMKKMLSMSKCITKISYPKTRFRRKNVINGEITKLLGVIRDSSRVGLNLGAGSQLIPDLINCDLYNPKAEMKLDITNLNAFEDGSVDLIESHHAIEHLGFAEVSTALTEWHRVLAPYGFLVITTPNLTYIAYHWLKLKILSLFIDKTKDLDYAVKMLVGSQEHPGMYHKSVYDGSIMRRLLPKFGFKVEFIYTPYPLSRTTPSLIVIARKW